MIPATLLIISPALLPAFVKGPSIPSFPTSLSFTIFTFSRKAFSKFTNGPLDLTKGATNDSPILAKAALMFEKVPFTVSLALNADSLNASLIAFENVLKSSFPFETMSRT